MADKLTRVKIRKGLYLVKRGEHFYMETCVHGTQERRALGTPDYGTAMKMIGEAAALANPHTIFPKPTPPPSKLTLDQALEEYETWYRKHKKASGAKRTLPTIEDFVDTVGGDNDTGVVIQKHVQSFIDAREGWSPYTIRNEFARVRAFLRWIDKKHKNAVDLDAVRGIDLPKDDGVTKPAPEPETVKSVIRAMKGLLWLQDYITVLIETGMRPQELLAARGVDFREKLLTIQPWGEWSPKSKWSNRTIELNEVAARILGERKEQLFDKTYPLFHDGDGKRRNVTTVSRQFQRLVPEGVTIVLYDTRHFFCSEHAAPGPQHLEIERLGAYIGHSPSSTSTLLRWYADQRALRRGAPRSLLPTNAQDATIHAMPQ